MRAYLACGYPLLAFRQEVFKPGPGEIYFGKAPAILSQAAVSIIAAITELLIDVGIMNIKFLGGIHVLTAFVTQALDFCGVFGWHNRVIPVFE